MPTSDVHEGTAPQTRRWGRTLLFVAAFVVLLALMNALLTLLLVPYGSKSEVVWKDYASADEIDCVMVGTSTIMRGVDPQIIDAELGTHSYNLATPNQMLDESYLAIKTAYEDHGISRVILGISYSQTMLDDKPNPGSTFVRERAKVVGLRQRLEADAYLLLKGGAITQASSLNMLFPWITNKVTISPSAIIPNVRMKLDGTSVYEAAEINERGWHYGGRGFGYFTWKLDYNTGNARPFVTAEDFAAFAPDAETPPALNAERARALDDILNYCSEHDIKVTAVVPPVPDFALIDYGPNYDAFSRVLCDYLEARGTHCYDFNLARNELYDHDEADFTDSEHLNRQGVDKFTPAICDLIKRGEAGEDLSALFGTAAERVQAMDHISCVVEEVRGEADGIHINARAVAGPSVDVEYQYLRKVGEEWVVLRDWSDDPSYVFVPEGGERGRFELCMSARRAGTDVEYDRYRLFTVLY